MRRAIFLLTTASIFFAAAFATAQGGARPTGPPPQNPAQTEQPKATALILGQVIDGTSGQPIPDAVVTLIAPGGRGRANPLANLQAAGGAQGQQAAAAIAAAALGGRASNAPPRVMTGPDGRFVFHGLLPGQYQVQASLTGYTQNLTFTAGGSGIAGLMAAFAGAGGGGGGGTTIQVKEGEFVTAVKMKLWKFAVVTGTVVDDGGEPAIGVTVQVARRALVAGRTRFIPGQSTKTDDRGSFRINNLVPGNYVVLVPQTQVSIPSAVMSSVIDSVTGKGPAGGGFAMLDVLSSGIDPTQAMTGGVRVGDYMVSSSGLLPIMSPDGRLQVFQTTFYPSASSPMQATVVSLNSGEERADVNFQLRLIPTSRVSGTAMGPDGPVANLAVRLVVPGDGTVSESEFDVASAMSRSDGTFVFYGVPPGNFVLRASKAPRPEIPAEMLTNPLFGQMFGGAGAGKPTTKEMLFASADVSVAGNVDNVALQLAPGFHVSGRIEFESRSNKPAPTGNAFRNISILLTAIDGRTSNAGILGDLTPAEPPNAQGEFKTKGFQAGKYFLTVQGGGGWIVKSAMVGSRDVLDAPFDLTNEMAGVVVTLVDQMAAVSGTVTSPGETDLSETMVLIFPYAYRSWITNGMSGRLAKSARATRNGAFNIPSVPPGEYFAVAIDRATQADMQDPAVIDALSRQGTRLTVTNDPARVDLTKVRVGK